MRTGAGLRLTAWVVLVLGLLPGQLIWVWALRGSGLLEREGVLMWGQVVLGLAAVGVFVLLKTTPGDAIRLPGRVSAWVVVGGTAVLQSAAVFWLAPVLSDDLFRYRMDGRMWLAGRSPYSMSPTEFLAVNPADPVDALVPYKEWRTIYPPASQA